MPESNKRGIENNRIFDFIPRSMKPPYSFTLPNPAEMQMKPEKATDLKSRNVDV
jgi:hypothetical protein